MNFPKSLVGPKIKNEYVCLVDSTTTHIILKVREYFSKLIASGANVNVISGSANLIEGFGRAIILLPRGKYFVIDDALFLSKSQRNLLSFKDIRQNGYHIETTSEKNIKYLQIIKVVSRTKYILEKLLALSFVRQIR
ncbi:Integrase, catalytic core [Gossypium australe]|uniref:Integrase, catalytic core n=1 Tax=Gossypium australe TaxID=47621 RepID=A0A5B6VWJ2_9ROSI|nr:Integrase, catalytic core [Gossypium australe]